MNRNHKARAKRVKPASESAVYTTPELCARYQHSRRTLRRLGEGEGYPAHWKSGRNEVYSKQEVHEWEMAHRPHLHSKPEMSEEDKHWDRLGRQYRLDKETAEANGSQPPEKPPRRKRKCKIKV